MLYSFGPRVERALCSRVHMNLKLKGRIGPLGWKGTLVPRVERALRS